MFHSSKKLLYSLLFSLVFLSQWAEAHTPKIVGLMQVRNEEMFIEQCLRALSLYVDAIVVLEDASEDHTLEILQQLRKELPIERIIIHDQSSWQVRDERYNRQALLDAGRAIEGTHFIMIDADEMFTAECATNNWLRNKILALEPGQIMTFPMMHVWNSVDLYRDDKKCHPLMPRWSVNSVLCDDGVCNYNENRSGVTGIVHVSRCPQNRVCSAENSTIAIQDINRGMIHFKCANTDNIVVKRVWYMCLEFIRACAAAKDPIDSAKIINKCYDGHIYNGMFPTMEEMILKEVPKGWYKGYAFFDKKAFTAFNQYRKDEVLLWFDTYGLDFFKLLNIWDVDWVVEYKNGQVNEKI